MSPTQSQFSTARGGALSRMRCVRHADREAAACCAACGLAFCRECVSEHEGRLLCAACLEKLIAETQAAETAARRRKLSFISLTTLKRAFMFAAGAAWIWLCFYLTGLLINKIPQSAHEGTIWKQTVDDAAEKEDAK